MNRSKLMSLLIILILTLIPASALAQDGPEIVGDPNAEHLQIVRDFVATRDLALLDEDVAYYPQAGFEPVMGVNPVMEEYELFYGTAFTNVTLDPVRYIVNEGVVVAEYWFTGTHVDQWNTIAATDLDVALPVAMIFDLEGGVITEMRQYYDAALLYAQLGYPAAGYESYMPSAIPPETEILEVDEVADENREMYMGTTVTVEGNIGERVGMYGFLLWDEDLIDLRQERVLVVYQQMPEEFVPVEGSWANVTGVVQSFNFADLESGLGMDLDEEAFADYDEETTVIMGESMVNLEDVWTPGWIQSQPDAYMGRSFIVTGKVGEVVDPNTFTVYEDQAVGIAGEILVVYDSAEVMFTPGDNGGDDIQVTGTIHGYDVVAIEDVTGLDLDDDAFADYEGMPVMVAESITME
jgi:hypothetical protein